MNRETDDCSAAHIEQLRKRLEQYNFAISEAIKHTCQQRNSERTNGNHDDESWDQEEEEALDNRPLNDLYDHLTIIDRCLPQLLQVQRQLGPTFFAGVSKEADDVHAAKNRRHLVERGAALLSSRYEETKLQMNDVEVRSAFAHDAAGTLMAQKASSEPEVAPLAAIEERIKSKESMVDCRSQELQTLLRLVQHRQNVLLEKEASLNTMRTDLSKSLTRIDDVRRETALRTAIVEEKQKANDQLEAKVAAWRNIVNSKEGNLRLLEEEIVDYMHDLSKRERVLASRRINEPARTKHAAREELDLFDTE